ncbi:MAG: hypothetical protein ACKVHE_21215 [Planctomycetales bacterium]
MHVSEPQAGLSRQRLQSRLSQDAENQGAEQREALGVTEWLETPFAALADVFLEDVKGRKSGSTHQAYRYTKDCFCRKMRRATGPSKRLRSW